MQMANNTTFYNNFSNTMFAFCILNTKNAGKNGKSKRKGKGYYIKEKWFVMWPSSRWNRSLNKQAD